MLIEVEVDGHPTRALIDPQMIEANLISTIFSSTYNLLTVMLDEEITGNQALQGSRGKSTHYVKTTLKIVGHMIPVYLLVVALADWDLILGEPILSMLQAMIDVSKQVMMIQADLTDRPITLSGIIDKTPRRYAVLAALVTVAGINVIVKDYQE